MIVMIVIIILLLIMIIIVITNIMMIIMPPTPQVRATVCGRSSPVGEARRPEARRGGAQGPGSPM